MIEIYDSPLVYWQIRYWTVEELMKVFGVLEMDRMLDSKEELHDVPWESIEVIDVLDNQDRLYRVYGKCFTETGLGLIRPITRTKESDEFPSYNQVVMALSTYHSWLEEE